MPLRGGIGGDHILYIDFNERFDLDSRIRDAERQGATPLCGTSANAGIERAFWSNINKYFAMIYGEISIRGRFRFITAGHHPPAVFSKERGQFVSIGEARRVSSIPVGMLPSAKDPDASVVVVKYTP